MVLLYGCQNGGAVGLSQETILRNTMGLKNTVSMLLEARSAGGPTRPDEAIPANNRFGARRTRRSTRCSSSSTTTGRSSRWSRRRSRRRPVPEEQHGPDRFPRQLRRPGVPRPHPGEAPPPDEPPEGILDLPPCGYLLTDAQLASQQDGSRPRRSPGGARHQGSGAAGQLVRADEAGAAGLIPLLLDGEAAEPMVAGTRIMC